MKDRLRIDLNQRDGTSIVDRVAYDRIGSLSLIFLIELGKEEKEMFENIQVENRGKVLKVRLR